MTDCPNSFLPRTLRTVFLDRDGVLNRKLPEGRYVTSWSDFQPLPGVPQAIARLNRAGLRLVVVTNQRGVALGLYTSEDVRTLHSALQSWLHSHGAHIDAFFFCPHDKQQCNCRKPFLGLFEQARAQFPEISAASSVMIGDSLSDIQFGNRLGMKTIFLEGYPVVSGEPIGPSVWNPAHQKPGAETARRLADSCFPSFTEAADSLLTQLASANQTTD